MLRGRGRGGYLVSCGGEGRVEVVRVMVVGNVVCGTDCCAVIHFVQEVQQTKVHWVSVGMVGAALRRTSIYACTYVPLSLQWRYNIRLENFTSDRVQLRERHWRIYGSTGTLETVKGRGVIGQVGGEHTAVCAPEMAVEGTTLPLCTATLPLCTATLPLCTATLPLCTTTLPLCTATLPLCTATPPLCTATLPLCTATPPLCTATLPLCTVVSS